MPEQAFPGYIYNTLHLLLSTAENMPLSGQQKNPGKSTENQTINNYK